MDDKLINRIENKKLTGLYYNTACLKVTEGNDFDAVYGEMIQFVKMTIQEDGCIEFFAAPSDLEAKEIILWEVWRNAEDLQNHMNQEHTKTILAKNLVEFKWGSSADMASR